MYIEGLRAIFTLVWILPISGLFTYFIFPETPENAWFCGVFREYKMGILAGDG